MCDQTPVDYKDGDIAWVKLGPCWWPGEVQDLNKLPSEWLANFKKPPIVAVKFFEEDAYEYVKSIDKIYSYNCSKKNDFIKKGLDLYRAKNSFMEKFPADVITAEKRTNGDPDIINSPIFSPEKKPNFAALIFGTPKSKKTTKTKRTSSSSHTFGSPRAKPASLITHPRFVGNDDHEVRILVQSPSKPETTETEMCTKYNCMACGFTTPSIDVIILHNKSHTQGAFYSPVSTSKRGQKSPLTKRKKKLKMTRSKTSSIFEDLALVEKGILLGSASSDDISDKEFKDEPKRKKKKIKRKPKKTPPSKPEIKTDIRVDLLAEWDEDDSDGNEGKIELNTSSNSASELSTLIDKPDELNESETLRMESDEPIELHKHEDLKKQSDKPYKPIELNKRENLKKTSDKSCFDFEEEEEESEIVRTAAGRKIPRVIPPTDKQKAIYDDNILSESNEHESVVSDVIEETILSTKDDKIINIDDGLNHIKDVETNIKETEEYLKQVEDEENLKHVKDEEDLKHVKDEDLKHVKDEEDLKQVEDEEHLKQVEDEESLKEVEDEESLKQVDDEESLKQVEDEKNLKQVEDEKNLKQVEDEKSLKQVDDESSLKQVDDESLKQVDDESLKQVEDESLKQIEDEEDPKQVEDEENPKQVEDEESLKQVEIEESLKQVDVEESLKQLEDEETFKDILESTSVPVLPELPNLLKCEQNFHSSKTIKFPDKSIAEKPAQEKEMPKPELKNTSEVTAKLINPKKRFVKSFETFEQLNNEQKRLTEFEDHHTIITAIEEKVDKEQEDSKHFGEPTREEKLSEHLNPEVQSTSVVEVSKLKTQLMSKLENADKLKRLEQNKSKKLESSRSTRLFKKVSSRQNEESCISASNKSNILEAEVNSKLPYEDSTILPKGNNKTEGDKVSDNFLSSTRFSVKMPSVAEMSDNEQIGEVLELNEMEILAEHADQIEVKQDTEVLKVEQAVVEMSSIESQICGNNQKDLILNHHDNSKTDDIDKMDIDTDNPTNNLIMESSSIINNQCEEPKDNIYSNQQTLSNIKERVVDQELIDKDSEDLSALTTLATVSELTTSLVTNEKFQVDEGDLTTLSTCSNELEKPKATEGNLTFLTEDVLSEEQIEIVNASAIEQLKPKSFMLSSFSVDFTDPTPTVPEDIISEKMVKETKHTNQDNNRVVDEPKIELDETEIIEKSLEKVFEDESSLKNVNDVVMEAQTPLILSGLKKSEPKQISFNKSYLEKVSSEYTSSSKLLEILTDVKQKPIQSDSLKSNILNVTSKPSSSIEMKVSNASVSTPITKPLSKFDSKRFIIKSATPSKATTNTLSSKLDNKPIILSNKVIKPVPETDSVSVQRVTSKRVYQDIEDIDTFIIQKPSKKLMVLHESDVKESISQSPKSPKKIHSRGKARILQQTIIKPSGEIGSPITSISSLSTSQPIDDNMFDINSMPIVMGDQILTAESIENIPVVLTGSTTTTSKNNNESTNVSSNSTVSSTSTILNKSQNDEVKILNKSLSTPTSAVKTYPSSKLVKSQRHYPAGTTKIVKGNPAIITRTGKSEKFIIIPSTTTTTAAGGSKYTVGKRPSIVKKSTPVILPTPPTNKLQTSTSEPTGNKIMIVTNQQGQQSRVLLTPAQQKLLGYQTTGSKLVKSTLKGNILQKVSNTKSTIESSKVPPAMSHAIVNSKGEIISTTNQNLITADGQVLVSMKPSQMKGFKVDVTKTGRKVHTHKEKTLEGLNTSLPAQQKTIIIKNQQGQIVKKFQGTDDALLEQQVAEKLQAIKASGSFTAMKAKQETTTKIKPVIRRSYPKKLIETTKPTSKSQVVLNPNITLTTSKHQKSDTVIPPLAPISGKRSDSLLITQPAQKIDRIEPPKKEQISQKPLNQLIIQDSLGNQTTITEGQILALPSGEIVDGQPQSYMLVTLDESGNLAPLNNEALLSLDPNLCLGGDLSNMVLQVDDGSNNAAKQSTTVVSKSLESSIISAMESTSTLPQSSGILQDNKQSSIAASSVQEQACGKPTTHQNMSTVVTEPTETSQQNPEPVQTVTCSIGNDPTQQLIITGDPISTQKFIESLTEGNPDLANLLASAEGNILIQTDDQQILINTDSGNPMLLPTNSVVDSSESNTNPVFAAQPLKNQDILAAALADTDVLQQEQNISPMHNKMMSQSQLSPNGGLYPSTIANVLGTTLSLSSPIMTPLEVPSTNNKKIPDDETDILTTEVPKNVDLPITITDPNISQTVAQQQVASLIANDLASGLELPLTISDHGVPLTSAEMNSPTYVYSLPSLDESVDMHPKTFSAPISMPLLNEEPQETVLKETIASEIDAKTESSEKVAIEKEESALELHSSIRKSNDIFTRSTSSSIDNLEDCDRSPTTDPSFLSTSIETEGLCTLGGAMCSSLSEPPPDMFDLSVVNHSYECDTDIKDNIQSNIPMACDTSENSESYSSKTDDCNLTFSTADRIHTMSGGYNNYDSDYKNDETTLSNAPLNSTSSSPNPDVDENSCEIPVQPQIVTSLSSSFNAPETTKFDSNKKNLSDDSVEENSKSKFD